MNAETKGMLQSKTIWGAITSIVAILSMKFGYDIGDQAMIVNAIIGAVGAALTVWGRITAVKKIG